MSSDYYIVKTDDDGDVCAVKVDNDQRWVTTQQLDRLISDAASKGTLGLENQGDDSISIWESAKDALAAIMTDPTEEDDD